METAKKHSHIWGFWCNRAEVLHSRTAFLASNQNQSCHSELSVTNFIATQRVGWGKHGGGGVQEGDWRRREQGERCWIGWFLQSLFLSLDDERHTSQDGGRPFNPFQAAISSVIPKLSFIPQLQNEEKHLNISKNRSKFLYPALKYRGPREIRITAGLIAVSSPVTGPFPMGLWQT